MNCPSCKAENPDGAEVCFECREVLRAITRGTVLASRYEIEGTLGKGGMGVVYAAHDRVLDEKVALKTLRSDYGADEELARRFRSEIKLARRVGHRNVCRIYEYGEDHGVRFIAMEYVDGIDLRQVLRLQGPLPVAKAFDLAIQTLKGVDAVHDVGIVHRDLKATNIMVDPRGVVRLMDFGIARREADATKGGLTGTGEVLGTPEYMSPEQARGVRVDFRSDVYALGVVIYEIFTGRVPFRGSTPMATLFMHVQEPPPLDGPEAARIPASVVPILRRALAKDVRDRYPDTKEMLAALVAARAVEVPDAPPSEANDLPTIPGRRPIRRRRSSVWFLAGLLVLTVAAFVVLRGDSLWLPILTTPASPVAARPSPTGSGSPVSAAPSAAPDSSPAPRSTDWIEPLTLQAAPTGSTSVASPNAGAGSSAAEPDAEKRGTLSLTVTPPAEVLIDDKSAGTLTSSQIALAPGPHVLVFLHADFEPLRRSVNVEAGGTLDLEVRLALEAVAKKPVEK